LKSYHQSTDLFMNPSYCLLPLLAAVLALPLHAAQDKGRPNILFLLADDMRADAMSCAGNPALQTPNLDALAARGTRFTNAFVTTAICCASRASFLTGEYARRSGVHDFATPLPDLEGAYPRHVQRAGYYTGFIGKWGVAAMKEEYLEECARSFDFWAGDSDQATYWMERECEFVTSDSTTQRKGIYQTGGPKEVHAAQGVQGERPHPLLKDPVHFETWVVPHKVGQFLDQQPKDKPFCLSISYKAPHGPWGGFAPQYAKEFKNMSLPKGETVTREDAEAQTKFLRGSLDAGHGFEMATDEKKRNSWQAQYYRLIRGLDESVGEVIDELKERGLLESTVIIFSSDHGYLLGEHGLAGKWLMFEESIRIPFIIADPRVATDQRGRTSSAMVLNIDLAPTVLDLAGVPVPQTMQGGSLVPLVADAQAAWPRESFFYEHLYDPKGKRHIESSQGVRTREWKYVKYIQQSGPESEQLFHLNADPLERRNLAADPASMEVLARMRAEHDAFSQNLR
jgi:arylsulfatase A-like enzyme